MQKPPFRHKFRDEKNSVNYEVFAYRELKEREVVIAIQFNLRHLSAKKRPRRGQTYELIIPAGVEES